MARKADILLRLPVRDDVPAIGDVLTAAFGRSDEARLVEAVRRDGDLTVELVAVENDAIVGYIGFSRHRSPDRWLALAPVAADPSRQRRGIGAELVRYGLDQARRSGARAVTVLGDGRFYRRFGFTYAAAENLTTPYDRAHTLLYPIAPGTAFAEERLVYAPAFG